jgi:FdhD protein
VPRPSALRRPPRFAPERSVARGRLETGEAVIWHVAEEVPVALTFNQRSSVVMMATPADLEDFAVGFAVTEDMVPEAAAIRGVTVLASANGYVVDVRADALTARASRDRAIAGRSGCGLCGVESLEDAVRPPRLVPSRPVPAAGAAARAFAALPARQPLNALNRSVHAAAWCGLDGAVLRVREDVGRHNALDKLVGSLLRDRVDTTTGFALLSSRCSFELVQKAAAAGIGVLATVSAPTTLALAMAAEAGMLLACLSPAGVVSFGDD